MALPVPEVRTCQVCGGPTPGRFALCFCCVTLVGQLRMPLAPVVALVDYRVGDGMHRRLRGYKDAPVGEARNALAQELAGLVRAWLVQPCGPSVPAGTGWDLVATVPSSARPAGAPVDAVVSRVPELARHHRRLLVRGPQATGHLRAARRGFTVPPEVDRAWLRRRRILVVDDSIITGARAQSAAAALRMAGGSVVGVMAVGRVVSGPPAGARRG
jgi:adenine/guanine phosphoribosyltransferase-like PRPP-binding protein